MPTLSTTTNNSFRYPTNANNGTDFATGVADLASDVDGMWLAGTLAGRPAAGTRNRKYYGTDTGLVYFDTGSAWLTMAVPGFGQDLLVPVSSGASTTMVAGNRYLAAGGTTMTLPTASDGLVVGLTANDSVSSSSPVTVAYGAGGGAIFGGGISASGASSFLLGMPVAAVTLYAQSGAWIISQGQQDTGWVPLTLGTNVLGRTGSYTPSCRLLGDEVTLRGQAVNNTGGTLATGTTWATLPAGSRPTATNPVEPAASDSSNATANHLIVSNAGVITYSANVANGAYLRFDGVVFSID